MWKSARYILLTYTLICALFFAYQHLLFFHPKSLDLNHVFSFSGKLNFYDSKISFDKNTVIDVVKFMADDTALAPAGVVLFFHGNRRNVEHYSNYPPFFTKHGYEVWMPDYPGFGRSTGKMETGLLEEISLQLYKMARTRFRPDQIVIYGKSLGTGLASYLASQRDCRNLILETPYYSLSSLTQGYVWFLPVPLLNKFNLKTAGYFKEITAPVTVMCASNDEVIPMENTLMLLPYLKPSDAFYIVNGSRHNGLPAFAAYQGIMDSVLVK